jgi:hypothetical protein
VDAPAAHKVLALDDGDALAELGRVERGFLAGGSGADHDQVV